MGYEVPVKVQQVLNTLLRRSLTSERLPQHSIGDVGLRFLLTGCKCTPVSVAVDCMANHSTYEWVFHSLPCLHAAASHTRLGSLASVAPPSPFFSAYFCLCSSPHLPGILKLIVDPFLFKTHFVKIVQTTCVQTKLLARSAVQKSGAASRLPDPSKGSPRLRAPLRSDAPRYDMKFSVPARRSGVLAFLAMAGRAMVRLMRRAAAFCVENGRTTATR